MKKLFKSAMFAAALFAASTTFAQTDKDTTTVGQKLAPPLKKDGMPPKKQPAKLATKLPK
jgi:hypothetical protein